MTGPKPIIDLGNLKAGGFIKERGTDLFTARLRVPGGRLRVTRLKMIAQVAEKSVAHFFCDKSIVKI